MRKAPKQSTLPCGCPRWIYHASGEGRWERVVACYCTHTSGGTTTTTHATLEIARHTRSGRVAGDRSDG